MTRRYDEATTISKIKGVLAEDRPWSRRIRRGSLRIGTRPPVTLICGGTPTACQFCWCASFLASFLVPAVYPLLLPSLVLFAWPAIALIKRRRSVKSRRPTDAAAFVAGVCGVDPAVPERFAQAARQALAAAYCIPVELIGSADTRRRIMALSALNQPLALEVIADICRHEGIPWSCERMYTAAAPFKKLRPANVAELVLMLHREMQSAQIL